MPDARAYPLVDETALFSQVSNGLRIPSKLSEAILRATNFLALICLAFGASCARADTGITGAAPRQFVLFWHRAGCLFPCRRLHCESLGGNY
jgi:hypothetical protein